MNKYMMLPLLALGVLASCVDDEGSYDYTPINTVTIEDLESTYNAISGITTLTIEPTVKGDIYGKNLDNYEFTWQLCQSNGVFEDHTHRVLSHEPVLEWEVDEPVGDYALYLMVKDKPSGVEKITYANLRIQSPFGRGFMLLGTDGSDDLAYIDMVSMPAAGDTVVVENALTNDGSIRKPKSLMYTGYYINSNGEYMWLFGEDNSWKLNSIHTADVPEFSVFGTFASLGIADNEYGYDNETAVDIFPRRAPGGNNLTRSTLGFITKDCLYGPTSANFGEYFGTPANRLENSLTSPLFHIYPKAFYNGSLTYISYSSTPFIVYNSDEDRFLKINLANYLNGTNCTELIDYSYAGWRWDCRSEDRKLVYGENTSTASTGCCFVMKSTVQDNAYDIYTVQITSAYSQTKEKFPVDLSIAKDFEKAERYCFIGCRRAVFYSVGTVLHQYDFERKLHLEMDLGAEITMIKPDFYSRNRHNDLMVATWDAKQKEGTLMKYVIGDNPNSIDMTLRNDIQDAENPNPEHDRYVDKWTSRLKIVDVEWRSR